MCFLGPWSHTLLQWEISFKPKHLITFAQWQLYQIYKQKNTNAHGFVSEKNRWQRIKNGASKFCLLRHMIPPRHPMIPNKAIDDLFRDTLHHAGHCQSMFVYVRPPYSATKQRSEFEKKKRFTKQNNVYTLYPDAPCMDYLPTLGEKWPHPKINVGKYSLHGASGVYDGICNVSQNQINLVPPPQKKRNWTWWISVIKQYDFNASKFGQRIRQKKTDG